MSLLSAAEKLMGESDETQKQVSNIPMDRFNSIVAYVHDVFKEYVRSKVVRLGTVELPPNFMKLVIESGILRKCDYKGFATDADMVCVIEACKWVYLYESYKVSLELVPIEIKTNNNSSNTDLAFMCYDESVSDLQFYADYGEIPNSKCSGFDILSIRTDAMWVPNSIRSVNNTSAINTLKEHTEQSVWNAMNPPV